MPGFERCLFFLPDAFVVGYDVVLFADHHAVAVAFDDDFVVGVIHWYGIVVGIEPDHGK